jgi:hypothetical protein
MSAQSDRASGWPVKAVAPPKLTKTQWVIVAVPGIVLLAAAVLQLLNFADFTDSLSAVGLPGPTVWAVCVILAELWGAAGFFMWRLSVGFRYVAYTMALAVALFWFVESLQLVTNNLAHQLDNNAFFGKLLKQEPGWWTVLEATLLLFWVLYAVRLMRDSQLTARGNR